MLATIYPVTGWILNNIVMIDANSLGFAGLICAQAASDVRSLPHIWQAVRLTGLISAIASMLWRLLLG